jgi:hypothetical protein
MAFLDVNRIPVDSDLARSGNKGSSNEILNWKEKQEMLCEDRELICVKRIRQLRAQTGHARA